MAQHAISRTSERSAPCRLGAPRLSAKRFGGRVRLNLSVGQRSSLGPQPRPLPWPPFNCKLSFRLERRDERTPHLPSASSALSNQCAEHALDAFELRKALSHDGQLLLAEPSRFGAADPIVKAKERVNLTKGESEPLRGFNEANSRRVFGPVAADPSRPLRGLFKQPLALVEPHRLYAHARRAGESTNRERGHLDSVPKYGPRLLHEPAE